jgi:hypothetical protein
MRLYTAGNFYLSSIQQGIQGAHVLAELFTKYGENTTGGGYSLFDWARNHKTMICLNGGNASSLREFYALLHSSDNKYLPYAKFHEDEQSLDNAMTCVGVVVPARIYDAVWVMPDKEYPAWESGEGRWFVDPDTDEYLTGWEATLATALKGMPLAR